MFAVPKISAEFLKRINRNKFSKKFKKFLLLTVAVFIVVMFCSGEYGLLKAYRLKAKIAAAEKEIEYLKVRAVDLNWEIDKLKSDSQYIKLYAAEKYGYAKADKTIIRFLKSRHDNLDQCPDLK